MLRANFFQTKRIARRAGKALAFGLLAMMSSVELAERLHEDTVSQALSYVSDLDEPISAAVGEELKEASKRAVWHPHPDDPPKG